MSVAVLRKPGLPAEGGLFYCRYGRLVIDPVVVPSTDPVHPKEDRDRRECSVPVNGFLFTLTRVSPVRNVAYRLALLTSIGGIVLLVVGGPGDDVKNTLGVTALAVAGLLAGLGKAVDVLGYVQDGATDSEPRQ